MTTAGVALTQQGVKLSRQYRDDMVKQVHESLSQYLFQPVTATTIKNIIHTANNTFGTLRSEITTDECDCGTTFTNETSALSRYKMPYFKSAKYSSATNSVYLYEDLPTWTTTTTTTDTYYGRYAASLT